MKTRSIQTLLLAATLGLLATACSNDSDQTVDITKPINVKLLLTTTGTNIPISRAAIGATEFDKDDVLGLYIAHTTGAEGDSPITSSLAPKNAPWVNGSFTGEPLYWQNVTDKHTLYAYFPYTENATDGYTVPNVSIKSDQNSSSTAADYEAADLLWGKCTTVATNNASISMKHCMSQITVTLSPGDGYSSFLPDIDKVELLCSAGFALSGTWNLADGKVTKANDAAATDAAAASTTSITTYAHSVAGATTYRAIVLPGQAFTNSSQFVKVTSGSNTYTYYLAMSSSENLTTEANKTYNFDLSLNKAGLTLKGITIAAWDTDEIEGDAGMDIGN
ncbi:fimbrillin family protein [Bacteroides uniformis]|uniref:fimbrillin family protein n=1 Tax=Bacteroides uniformis TaxID=820 RepID=UPI003514C596